MHEPCLEELRSSPETVMDILRTNGEQDADGHDATWWAQRLWRADWFANLDEHDRAALLRAVATSTQSSALRLREQLRHAIRMELQG